VLHDAGVAPGTLGRKRAALRCFLEFREEFEEDEHAGQLLRAMNRLKMPPDLGSRREPNSITADQVQGFLDAATERSGTGVRVRALLHFLWSTGTRRADVCNLALPDSAFPKVF